jgi:hypothetical protein
MQHLGNGFTFNAERHEYKLGTQIVPATTGVIRGSGLVPHRFIDLDELERRSELGKAVHLACHLHNLARLGDCDERVKPHLHAWIEFKQKCKSFRLISSEYQTVAFVNGMPYGMQLDCNASIDRDDTIIELKIGRVYPHHGVQTASYAAGAPHPKYDQPLARFMARKRIVVELGADGKPKLHKFEQKSDYEAFASSLYMASWKQRHGAVYRLEQGGLI